MDHLGDDMMSVLDELWMVIGCCSLDGDEEQPCLIQESAFDRACFRAFEHLSMGGEASKRLGNCGNWWCFKTPNGTKPGFVVDKQSLPLK